MSPRTQSRAPGVPIATPEADNAAVPQCPPEGRARAVIEAVRPAVDGGDFAVKRTVGESVRVEADIFTDGHDLLSAVLLSARSPDGPWSESFMAPLENDRWAGEFTAAGVGDHWFTIQAWIDRFKTWRHELRKRVQAGQALSSEFLVGASLVEGASEHQGSTGVADELRGYAARLREAARGSREDDALGVAFDSRLATLMALHAPRRFPARLPRPLRVQVDREKARFSAWYELFPRSARPGAESHAAFDDVIGRLDAIAAMGFDVLYLPPIHPIGKTSRKGRNNSVSAALGDPGSPWAIGGAEGGHDAIHPELGSLADFRRLVTAARDRGIEIALDLALQCSPDHPYVRQHPGWFRHRPDGSIRYAENPPKEYQDIYPFDFECEDWRDLWHEILRVVFHWMDQGVRIFRVDNPHTKPFALWEWLITRARQRDPGVIFLAEAFTRPKIMYRLAKLGFTQSYTYFAWRNAPWELREYFTELTQGPPADFFRPCAWPNTPDILTEYLQHGGRAAFVTRAVLASTLCASWGVYGPAFELMWDRPARPGSEEYLDSEKYQLRAWGHDPADSLAEVLATLNRARRDHPALQQDRDLRFHSCDNPAIACYSKAAGADTIVVAVNTDPHNTQWGAVELDLAALSVPEDRPYQMHDLLSGARYRWQGRRNFVGLDPASSPAHVFHLRRHDRTERNFEYFL